VLDNLLIVSLSLYDVINWLISYNHRIVRCQITGGIFDDI